MFKLQHILPMRVIDKVQVTNWLKRHGRDRQWLAEKCHAEIGTVNSWFSTRGFSDAAKASISALMELDEIKESGPGNDVGSVQFTADEWEKVEMARAVVGNPPRPVFYHNAIMAFVERLQTEEQQAQKKRAPPTPQSTALPPSGTGGSGSAEGSGVVEPSPEAAA